MAMFTARKGKIRRTSSVLMKMMLRLLNQRAFFEVVSERRRATISHSAIKIKTVRKDPTLMTISLFIITIHRIFRS